MNDERRLAVVEGDSRAGDGLDITGSQLSWPISARVWSRDATQGKARARGQRKGGEKGRQGKVRRLYTTGLGGVREVLCCSCRTDRYCSGYVGRSTDGIDR